MTFFVNGAHHGFCLQKPIQSMDINRSEDWDEPSWMPQVPVQQQSLWGGILQGIKFDLIACKRKSKRSRSLDRDPNLSVIPDMDKFA